MLEIVIFIVIGLTVGFFAYLLFAPATETDTEILARESAQSVRSKKSILALAPNRYVVQAVGAIAALFACWILTQHPLFSVLVFVGVLVVPSKIYEHLRIKRNRLIDNQVPDALTMLSGAMRSGASLTSALDSVAKDGPKPFRTEIELMLREVRLGIDLDHALDHLATRIKSVEMVMVVAAIKIARESGGNLSEALENLSRSIRDRQNMEKKIMALTAQGRMQALVMAGLPFFMLYMLFQLDPPAMAPMFNSLVGWVVFIVVCVWVYIGFKFIKKIMSIEI